MSTRLTVCNALSIRETPPRPTDVRVFVKQTFVPIRSKEEASIAERTGVVPRQQNKILYHLERPRRDRVLKQSVHSHRRRRWPLYPFPECGLAEEDKIEVKRVIPISSSSSLSTRC